MRITEIITQRLSLKNNQVESTVRLLGEGATVPFISRYRKEATGGLDEVAIGAIKDEFQRLTELEKRKETVLSTIQEQGKLTDELRARIEGITESSLLEDLYLPYKPKRRTRAQVAREKGLEPLAATLMKQNRPDIESFARTFICENVADATEALAGASDILAEWVNESEAARSNARRLFARQAVIQSRVVKGKESEGNKYTDYFDFAEPLRRCPSHRLLAMIRGEREGFLKITVSVDDDAAIESLERIFLRRAGEPQSARYVQAAIADGWKRLLRPSMETETLAAAKERADQEAIDVFADNLRQLLLAPPLGEKITMGIDPGYRTGCKIVCLDRQGNLLHNETIYPHAPQNQAALALKKIASLVEMYRIEAIAVGDGTASRETEQLLKRIHFDRPVQVFMVSEDGASVYSASALAREEFPQYDVTVRGSVSIARRLMDPLAELVKIDPQSIGVGQYQHDVDKGKLKKSLDTVVESCVNKVGVNLNTASKELLTYVSGLGPSLAQNIVDYRAANGEFTSRSQLKKVPRLGEKAYEQCAGFLRIRGAKNPLDESAVHPESYGIVEQMARDLGATVPELISNPQLRQQIDVKKYVTPTRGLPTLQDILQELEKPGLDPRSTVKAFEFAEGIYSIDDLHEGMTLPGIVSNITNFGAFVDIGVKQDGLVHISQLADRYVSDPTQVVKLHQHVQVKVIGIDRARGRIQLTMKGLSK